MKKTNDPHPFLVDAGENVKLAAINPDCKTGYANKASCLQELKHYAQRLKELQYLLYAEGKRGLLICLQAPDAGGKDGTIRHVLGYMNPQGCRVQAFKAPTNNEAAHDFLWRAHRVTPAKGEVVIFNRSHYEDVLITRVHQLEPKKILDQRYDAINTFENHLVNNNIHILKFFLHISKEEQLNRFKKRLSDPNRHWKISEADYQEREYWGDYQQAYQVALNKCSSPLAPWFIIPSNQKWYRNFMVSKIVVEYLESLQMSTPLPKVDIKALKRKYQL